MRAQRFVDPGDDLILRLWKEARRGNRESASVLLLLFCDAVDKKETIPRSMLVYLRRAFWRHLKGGIPLERALLLRPAHRAKGTYSETTNPVHLAALSFLFRRIEQLSATEANDAVATERSTSRRNVERAVSANANFEQLSTEELLTLLIPEDKEQN